MHILQCLYGRIRGRPCNRPGFRSCVQKDFAKAKIADLAALFGSGPRKDYKDRIAQRSLANRTWLFVSLLRF